MRDPLKDYLKAPSVENWKAVVKLGRSCARNGETKLWQEFANVVLAGVKSWPKEIERVWPEGVGPSEFRRQVEWRIREVDTYGHYCQKIAGDPRLQLDGKQRVWLERRFTGGVVPASAAKQVISALLEAQQSKSWKPVSEAVSVLAGSIRNTGKTGTADLTGGLMLQLARDGISLTQECPLRDRVATNIANPHIDYSSFSQRKTLEVRLEVEIKVGDGEQRPGQIIRERSVRSRGGCYVLCKSVEEAVQQILAFIAQHE